MRTNFRLRGGELDADAIGRAIRNFQDGSIITARFHGGFIMGSFASVCSASFVQIDAKVAMSAFYGATFVSTLLGQQSGFLVMPFAAWEATIGGTVKHDFFPTTSTSGSVALIIPVRHSALSAGSVLEASGRNSDGFTVAVKWAGFIISTP